MSDRAMQALYLLALEPVSEASADPRSYGFRPERCTADAIEQCFIALATKRAAQWILEGDIQACFDKISHDWIIAHVPTDREMLRKWLQAGYLKDRRWFPTEMGVPQGGIISPAIANWVLDGLQLHLAIAFGPPKWIDGRQVSSKINFVRYPDDFVVTGPSKEVLEREVRPIIERFMQELGLSLSPEKTKVTHISEGFDFLGQNVRKYRGKLLIKPSKKNVQAFQRKIRSVINENRTAKQQNLIGLLNPVIKGWADYHRHVVSKRVFARVDSEIWRALWQWCCRRHPNKGRRWIKHRYFRCIGTRDWIFAAQTGEYWPDGKPIVTTLRYAAEVGLPQDFARSLSGFTIQQSVVRYELVAFALPAGCAPESLPATVAARVAACWSGMSRARLLDRARRLGLHVSLRARPGAGPDGVLLYATDGGGSRRGADRTRRPHAMPGTAAAFCSPREGFTAAAEGSAAPGAVLMRDAFQCTDGAL